MPTPKPTRMSAEAFVELSEAIEGGDWHDSLRGGLADPNTPGQFDPERLLAGIRIEMEHTDDPVVAAEIAMDHLIEDPSYYEKLSQIEGVSEAFLAEVEREFQDYTTPVHPHLQRAREDLKKALDWVVKGLESSGTPQMKRISQDLLRVPDLPSDQVLPTLKRATDELHKARLVLSRATTFDPTQKKRVADQAQAVRDALSGIPSIMKAAGALAASSGGGGDKNLWVDKPSGYVDDKTGDFRMKKITTMPRGQPDPEDQPVPAGARNLPGLKPSAPKKPGFFVRKKSEGEERAMPRMSEVFVVRESPVGKPPLEQARGKYLHVPQTSFDRGQPTPHSVQQQGTRYDDLDPALFGKWVTVDDSPATGGHGHTFKIGQDGELETGSQKFDTSD